MLDLDPCGVYNADMEKTLEQIAQEFEDLYEGTSDKSPAPIAVGKRPGPRVRLPQTKVRVDYDKK